MTDLAGTLTRCLKDALDAPDLDVTGVRRLSGGASRETFEVTLSGWSASRAAMQRVRPGALSASFSMEREAGLLRAASRLAVPVPPVIAASDDPDIAGAPFVVSGWIEGETIARRILRDEPFARARERFVGDAARALAGIHAIPPGDTALEAQGDPVDGLRALFDSLGEAHPAFELGFRWLDQHRPPFNAGEPTVVHGDFRLGNLMVGPDGLRAVLDWELAHLGDPMEDLGWFCVKAWRFGASPPVAGLGERDELFDAYEAASGRPVDRAAARWWEVHGTIRWGVICILQAQTHLRGAARSVELAAIGRRVCETEYDLLELLP